MSSYEESAAVLEERRRGEVDRRISHLELAHTDNTNKITTLIDGFNELNITLAALAASINVAVKVVAFGSAIATTSLAGLWTYHTYMTSQIDQHTSLSPSRLTS